LFSASKMSNACRALYPSGSFSVGNFLNSSKELVSYQRRYVSKFRLLFLLTLWLGAYPFYYPPIQRVRAFVFSVYRVESNGTRIFWFY
jgi:hypothetical protein